MTSQRSTRPRSRGPKHEPKPLLSRAKVAGAAIISAFVLAVVGAAGTQFYRLLSNRIAKDSTADASGASGPAVVPTATIAAIASPENRATPSIAAASSPSTTEVRIFQPFTYEGLRPFYKITRNDSGDCLRSYVSQDPAALHCFGDIETPEGTTLIYDPCWPSLDPDFDLVVACIDDPWTTEATSFQMTAKPEPDTTVSSLPWAMELFLPETQSGAVRCIEVFGHRGIVDGKPINYRCVREGREEGTVIGDLVKQKDAPWKAWYSSAASSDTVLTPVRTVWK